LGLRNVDLATKRATRFVGSSILLLVWDAVTRSIVKVSVAWLLVVYAILLGSWQAGAADLEISIPIQLTR